MSESGEGHNKLQLLYQDVNPEKSIGTGLKEVRKFLINLPPQGISIHGTQLSRAESIQENGFLPDHKKPVARHGRVEKGTFVYHLDPIPTDANLRGVLSSIEKAIKEARGWGREKNPNGIGFTSAEVGLVVTIPPEKPLAVPFMHDSTTEGVAYPGHLPNSLGKDRVLGVVPIKSDPREDYINREGKLARQRLVFDTMKAIAIVIQSNQDKIRELVENPPEKETIQPKRERSFFGHLASLLTKRKNLVDLGGLSLMHEARAVLSSDNPDPKNMVSLIKGVFIEGELYDKSAEVWEGYTIGQHTEMVMSQFERYFSSDFDSPLVTRYGFRLATLLHDIGKPINKTRQHEETLKIMPSFLRKMGVSEREIKVMSAVIDQDYIGHYLKSGSDPQSVSNEIKTRVSQLSQELGEVVDPAEYFKLIKILYMCDAGSYTVNAGGKRSLDHLFNFERKPRENRGRITFAPSTEETFHLLEEQFTGVSTLP